MIPDDKSDEDSKKESQETTKSRSKVTGKPNQIRVKVNATVKAKTKSPKTKAPLTTVTKTTTIETTTKSIDDNDYNYDDELEDDESISEMDYADSFAKNYWDIQCINRSGDDNFKSVKQINSKKSNVQVPVNVYKQDIAINMTAYWTEELDKEFSKNYDTDNELFWQYFCSTQGLFRRYPAAYWSGIKNDFFDCRLQTWYITAAASPKDVIILLDVSGSMTGLRLEIGKNNFLFFPLSIHNKNLNCLFYFNRQKVNRIHFGHIYRQRLF